MLHCVLLLLCGLSTLCMEKLELNSTDSQACVEKEMSKQEAVTLLAAFFQLPRELKDNVLSHINYFLIPSSTNSFGTIRTVPCNPNFWYKFIREQKRFCSEKQSGSWFLTYNKMPFYKEKLWYNPESTFIGPNRNGLIIESNTGRAYKIAKHMGSDFSSFKHNPIKLGNHDWPHQTYALHFLHDKWICYHERDHYVEEFSLSTDVQKKYRVNVPSDLMVVGYDRMDDEHHNLLAYTKGDNCWKYPSSIVLLNIKNHLQKYGTDSQQIITDIDTVVTLEDVIPQEKHEQVQDTTIQTSSAHPHLILIQVRLEDKKETYLCDRLQNNESNMVFDEKIGFLQCVDTLSSCTNYKMKKLPRKLLAIKTLPAQYKNIDTLPQSRL